MTKKAVIIKKNAGECPNRRKEISFMIIYYQDLDILIVGLLKRIQAGNINLPCHNLVRKTTPWYNICLINIPYNLV